MMELAAQHTDELVSVSSFSDVTSVSELADTTVAITTQGSSTFQTSNISNHPDFYFEDGSVILQVCHHLLLSCVGAHYQS
jgi:hypothetical protein